MFDPLPNYFKIFQHGIKELPKKITTLKYTKSNVYGHILSQQVPNQSCHHILQEAAQQIHHPDRQPTQKVSKLNFSFIMGFKMLFCLQLLLGKVKWLF